LKWGSVFLPMMGNGAGGENVCQFISAPSFGTAWIGAIQTGLQYHWRRLTLTVRVIGLGLTPGSQNVVADEFLCACQRQAIDDDIFVLVTSVMTVLPPTQPCTVVYHTKSTSVITIVLANEELDN
jgi:hypothetical protein